MWPKTAWIKPSFDKDNWPNMSDQTWAKDVHDYYGTTAPATQAL